MTDQKIIPKGSNVPLDEIWTAQDLAAYLKVSPRMITGMAVRGEIPGAIRVGAYWRFRSEQIRSWVWDR